MKDTYSKYKERSPQDTIFEAQNILHGLDLFPVLKWEGENREGFYSNRLTLYPTAIGVNGKGTDPLYSTASAYGELMERLQNNILLSPPLTVQEREEAGLTFRLAPDEGKITLESVCRDPDPFTGWLLEQLKEEDERSDGEAFLHLFASSDGEHETLLSLPFADPFHHRIVDVPAFPARRISGTNGMAAGNTLEEAMVQGLSELFEREANLLVLEGKAVPPVIPDDVLRQYDLYRLIEDLRKNPDYEVEVLDCSLGKGWPVVALAVYDREHGTFGIRFGAHPSFPVALERTLTEAAQGKKLSQFVRSSRINTLENASCNANLHNVISLGDGYYPSSLFYQKPDWEFRPWTRFQGNDNRAFLKEMLQLLKEEGYTPLIRDASFLGFPSVYILIPGFHTMTHFDGRSVRLKRTLDRACASFRSFSELSEEEMKRILRLVKVFKYQVFSNLFGTLSGSPTADPRYSNHRIGAYLSLRLEDYPAAAEYFRLVLRTVSDPEEKQYLVCMKHYSELRADGYSETAAKTLLRRLHRREAAERVCRETEDLSELLDQVFPALHCPDCKNCAQRGAGCQYEAQKELYIRLQHGMKKENVSQEGLLNLLAGL